MEKKHNTPRVHNEIRNEVTQAPRVFYARHMQPGVAQYDEERILVDTAGMKALIATGAGIPVYIQHQDVDFKTMKQNAAGYVSDSFYNTLDGWAWFKFIAIDDEAHAAVKRGWSVSNAYKVGQKSTGGTKNNCSYAYEVKNGQFTHLAIVPNPRYEDACILTPEEFKAYQEDQKKTVELHNSKTGEPKMLNMFKMKKEEVSTVDADTSVELTNGKSMTIGEMVAIAEAEHKKEAQTVLVNGKKITVEELAKIVENAAKKNTKKKNTKAEAEMQDEGEEEDCMNESEEEEEESDRKDGDKFDSKKNKKNVKKNESEEEVEEEEEEQIDKVKKNKNGMKKNSLTTVTETDNKFFDELRNAHLATETADSIVEVPATQLARGKDRYGSSSK